MYGDEIELDDISSMLFLRPSTRCFEVKEDHLERLNKEISEDLLQMAAYSANATMSDHISLVRFSTTTAEDSVLGQELRTINTLVKRRKTLKAIQVPQQLKAMMQKTKCSYAFVVVGDLWARSKENIAKIDSKSAYRDNPVGRDVINLTVPTSFMTWMVFDLNKDSLVLWNFENAMPDNKDGMMKQFQKMFKESFK